jgi:uncharacterized protein YjbJ (UPF0337 family)
MNRDEITGKVDALKGKAKQAAGDFLDDPELQDEGVADEAEGETREAVGRAKRKVGEAVENVGKVIKR